MKHTQSTRSPLTTAQKLTETGMERETADVIAGAIHDVHVELSELSKKVDDIRTERRAENAERKVEIAELKAMIIDESRKASYRFIGWMFASATLAATVVGIAVTVLIKLFAGGN